jgi:dihydroorotate dehydrogenase
LWKPIFFRIDPEKVHHLVVTILKLIKPFLAFNAHKYTLQLNLRNNKNLEREVFGIKFPNPVGLAAGFDKNAEIYKNWNCNSRTSGR